MARVLRGITARGLRGLDACRRVELFLVRSPLIRLIVLPAPRVAALATMVLSTTKRAAEILSTRIPRMREEANSTAATGNRTLFQTRTIAQDGIERELILTNKRTGAIVLVPIFAKRKNFPDGYDKIARFSVKMLIVLSISSSYSLDAKASRCRARIFYATAKKLPHRIRATHPRLTNSPTHSSCPEHVIAPRAPQKRY